MEEKRWEAFSSTAVSEAAPRPPSLCHSPPADGYGRVVASPGGLGYWRRAAASRCSAVPQALSAVGADGAQAACISVCRCNYIVIDPRLGAAPRGDFAEAFIWRKGYGSAAGVGGVAGASG